MFQRFTDRARRVVVLAQHEARTLDHDYIGTEHILLGLIDEGQGVATTALTSMGISLEEMRQAVRDTIGRGAQPPESGHIPFTPQAKKVLELSLRESMHLGHDYIGTEHILLALIREGGGAARSGLGRRSPARGRRRAHGPADLDRQAAGRDRAPAQAVGRWLRLSSPSWSAGRTPHRRRLSPRCQSVPTSAKPAALRASTWVASSVDSDTW